MPSPQVIFLIRHAEKPATENGVSYTGVDVTGAANPHCLVPRGWERAGALATLFGPAPRIDVATPGHLHAPAYSTAEKTINHRTYETILPLSERLGLTIGTSYREGEEASLAASILQNDGGISLVAWEHDHIPDIAANIPVVPGTEVPTAWPDDRFDLIWCFTSDPGGAYEFSLLPQSLLSGDGAV